MTMNFRRSEDWKERASRVHSAAALTCDHALAPRVQLGQHLQLPRACGGRSGTRSSMKQGPSQSAMNGVTRFEGLAPRTERRPFCERRALAPPDDHHAVGSCADLLSALRAGTCQVRALHAIRAGPRRVDSDDVRPSTRPVGTVVRCRRQPEKVHARGRPGGISGAEMSSYRTPYVYRSARSVGPLPLTSLACR